MGFTGFVSDEEGATAIEYGLIASLIATVILSAIYALSDANATMWTELANHIAANT